MQAVRFGNVFMINTPDAAQSARKLAEAREQRGIRVQQFEFEGNQFVLTGKDTNRTRKWEQALAGKLAELQQAALTRISTREELEKLAAELGRAAMDAQIEIVTMLQRANVFQLPAQAANPDGAQQAAADVQGVLVKEAARRKPIVLQALTKRLKVDATA